MQLSIVQMALKAAKHEERVYVKNAALFKEIDGVEHHFIGGKQGAYWATEDMHSIKPFLLA